MSQITLSSTVVVGPRQVSTELGNEVVVLGADAGQYFGLNEVGARIWSFIQKPTRVDTVCARIVEEYEVDPAQCERDVLELLHDLHGKGLIHVEAELGSP
jgi:hypothetical protein